MCTKVHPEYSAMNFLNDIVILKLNESVGNVPTPLLAGPNTLRDGDFYLAGWGGTKEECNQLRKRLHHVTPAVLHLFYNCDMFVVTI